MISKQTLQDIAKLIGQYIVDNSNDLIITECSDMTGDEIVIRMIRRKSAEMDSLGVKTKNENGEGQMGTMGQAHGEGVGPGGSER